MGDSNIWAVIYLVLAVAAGIGEMATPGAFFLAPFAVGGLGAAAASLLGAGGLVALVVFLVVSGVSFAAMRPLARHLDKSIPEVAGVGANRLVGLVGPVTQEIPATAGETGMVKVAGEEWRAETTGSPIPVGTSVRVLSLSGTRLMVEPTEPRDRWTSLGN